MQNIKITAAFAIISLAVSACGGSGGGSDNSIGDSDSAFMASDPPLQTSQAQLDDSLNCTPFENPQNPPVLLVHGTTTTGTEQYTTFYTPQLVAAGFDVCAVTYPDRGLIDQQISAEYVVNALRTMHAQTGRRVAMIGHSQGASMPRWALRFFPSARAATQEFVLIASPSHGTTVSLPAELAGTLFGLLGLDALPIGLVPEAIYQFGPNSNWVAAVNSVDETPGDIDYSSIYTLTDELVQPVVPVPTAALDFGENNPRVSNILLQDICPTNIAEHLSIGTTDALTFMLALDAISNPGPANFERAGGQQLCNMLPIDLANLARPENATALVTILQDSLAGGAPDPHLASSEPPLMPYAQGAAESQ